jgi:hypothetical protein
MSGSINSELIERIKSLHEKLLAHNVAENSYHLLGLFGSSDDDLKLSLNIKRGKYTIIFEIYSKDRGEKHTLFETADIDEACEYFFRKAIYKIS